MSVVVGSHVARQNVRGWIYYVSRLADDGRDERVPVWISDLGESEDAADNAETLLAGTRRTNGGESLVLSFAAREMDINNPDDVQECGDLAYKLAKLIAPNCPAIVGVHVDSDGGLVHAHILILNHDVSTGLSNQNDMRITRCRRINDELMVETGHEVCPLPEITGPSYYNDGQEVEPETRVELADATTRDTVRAYLRQEVDAAMAEPGIETVEDLAEVAAERGLSIQILPDNGHGKTLTYAAVDEDGETIKHEVTGGRSKKPRNISVAQKAKGLGAGYTYESLDKKLKEVAKEATAHQEAVAAEAETDPAVAEALAMQDKADAALRASIGAESPRDRMARLMTEQGYDVPTTVPEKATEVPEEPTGVSEPEEEFEEIDIDTPEPGLAPMPEPEIVYLAGEDGDQDTDATVVPVAAPVVEEEPVVPVVPVVPPVVEDDDDEEEEKVEVVADPEPVTVPAVAKEPEAVKVEDQSEPATSDSDGGDDGHAEPEPVDVDAQVKHAMYCAPHAYVDAAWNCAIKVRQNSEVTTTSAHHRVMQRLRTRVRTGIAGAPETAYADAARSLERKDGSTANEDICVKMKADWWNEYGEFGDRRGQLTYEQYQQRTHGSLMTKRKEEREQYVRMQAVAVDRDRQPGG